MVFNDMLQERENGRALAAHQNLLPKDHVQRSRTVMTRAGRHATGKHAAGG